MESLDSRYLAIPSDPRRQAETSSRSVACRFTSAAVEALCRTARGGRRRGWRQVDRVLTTGPGEPAPADTRKTAVVERLTGGSVVAWV